MLVIAVHDLDKTGLDSQQFRQRKGITAGAAMTDRAVNQYPGFFILVTQDQAFGQRDFE
ncbi:hypothetical protein D3C85_1797670 [compost metagenome]